MTPSLKIENQEWRYINILEHKKGHPKAEYSTYWIAPFQKEFIIRGIHSYGNDHKWNNRSISDDFYWRS